MRITAAAAAAVVVVAAPSAALFSACQPEEGAPHIVLVLADGTECDEDTIGCAFDFGVVTGEAGAEITFKLKNDGDADGTIVDVGLVGDPSITVVAKPDEIAAGTAADITFKAAPRTTTRIATSATIAWASPETEIKLALSAGDSGGPHLSVDPASCDFGAVAQGAEGDCTLTLANTGDRDLVLDVVEIADGEDVFAFAGGAPAPGAVIAAGASTVVIVSARPTGDGGASGLVRIASNDPTNNGSTFVTLTVSSPAHIVLPDGGCDFGDVTTGTLADCDVVVGNDGVSDLVLTGIALTAAGDAFGFRQAPPEQVVVSAGGTATITVTSGPPDVGAFEAALEFDTNDPDTPHASVPLHVNGVAP